MKLLRVVLLVAIVLGGTRLVLGIDRELARITALAPEYAVAALPGVGQGWLDTLRMIAGDARIEAVGPKMIRDEGPYLLGVEEPWHGLISVRTDMRAYARYIRDSKQWEGGYGYQHPLTMCNPAGVTAHEFGHRFRESLWPHEAVRESGDSLPTYAQGGEEEFADRFARAMLALRGWDSPDTTDKMLNHVVRFRLMQARAR